MLFDWRRLIIGFAMACAIVAVVVSLLLPSWYSAVATILPPQQASSGGGLVELVAQLGSGFQPGSGARAAQRLLSRSPVTDLALGVLKSERIRGQVVDRFGLVEIYDVENRQHAIRALGDHLESATTPEGLVQVRVEDRDRQRAADMANAFVEFLDEFNRAVSVDTARRTRVFIEHSLESSRERLEGASAKLRAYQEEHGAIQLTEQTRVTVEALASLVAERTKLEIQRDVLERYSTPTSTELQRIDAEIRAIDGQLGNLMGSRGVPDTAATTDDPTSARGRFTGSDEGVLLPLGDIPRLGLEFADLKREVLVQEKVYEYLIAQYEEARIRETQDQETVTVLDPAATPLRKTRPRRSLIVIVATLAALGAAVGFVLVAEKVLEVLESPGSEWRVRLPGLHARLAWLRSSGRPARAAGGD